MMMGDLTDGPTLKRYVKKMRNQVLKTSKPNMAVLDIVYTMLIQGETMPELMSSIYILLANYAYVGTIQHRFIPIAIAHYSTCTKRSVRNEIMFFMSNIYYDKRVNVWELMISGFVAKCLPIYIADTRYNLNNYLMSPDSAVSVKNYLSTELEITIDFIWLYIAEHRFSWKTASVYYDIFTILSNIAYEDIVYKEFVELAMHMYLEHVTFPDLDCEILYFLRNVYFDKVGITYLSGDFLSTYVINFVTRRADVYPELAAELLCNFTRFMNEEGLVTKQLIDLALRIVDEYSDTDWAWNHIHVFFKHISDPKLLDYMVGQPLAKLLVENTFANEPENVFNLIRLFSSATTSNSTELPCQFFYTYIFEPFQKKGMDVYPRYMLLALSNILATNVNLEFVNLDLVLNYVVDVLETYPTSSDLYEDIFFVMDNMNHMGLIAALIHTPNFMDHFHTWISLVDCSHVKSEFVYRSIAHIFRAIAQDESLLYHFDSDLGTEVRKLGHKSDEVYKTVCNTMHCTLQQKCALLCYNHNKISLDDLKALDVTIYT